MGWGPALFHVYFILIIIIRCFLLCILRCTKNKLSILSEKSYFIRHVEPVAAHKSLLSTAPFCVKGKNIFSWNSFKCYGKIDSLSVSLSVCFPPDCKNKLHISFFDIRKGEYYETNTLVLCVNSLLFVHT